MKNRTRKNRIYRLYRSRDISLKTPRKNRYMLEDLLNEMPENLPMNEGWNEIVPVGREFGSKDYERLAQLDALADAAKAAADRAAKSIDQTLQFVDSSNKRIQKLEDGLAYQERLRSEWD